MAVRLSDETIPEAWTSLWFDREAYEEVAQDFDWLDVFPFRKGRSLLEQEDPFLLPASEPILSAPKVAPPSQDSSAALPACKRPRTSFTAELLLPLDFSDEPPASRPLSRLSRGSRPLKPEVVLIKTEKGIAKASSTAGPAPKKSKPASLRAISPPAASRSSHRLALSEAASDLGTRQLRSESRPSKLSSAATASSSKQPPVDRQDSPASSVEIIDRPLGPHTKATRAKKNVKLRKDYN
ncbi:hypothetical protein M413DRAFT_28054, partial [Hebeloma cylindrosporum]